MINLTERNRWSFYLVGASVVFFLMSQINSEWPIYLAVAVMMGCSFFVGTAAGCVFAVVPLIKRRLTREIAVGITVAAMISMLLDEPKGTMVEVMPDGTV